MIRGQEVLIIALVILLLFGAKKLPELAGSIGKSLKEFRKATDEAQADREAERQTQDDSTPPAPRRDTES